MTTYDVFISYRRSDGTSIAESIAEYLTSKGLHVFFDKNEIKDSQDFKNRIENSLRQAPNYLLIATTNAFQFYTDQEDWVKREMEIACENYDGNSGSNRVITVVAPQSVVIPRQEDLPESIRCLANPNRIMFDGELPAETEKMRILKAVTQINRHNLWNAGHHWLEDSKESGGRFASLDINASLFPNAEKTEQKYRRSRRFPIYVQKDGDSLNNANQRVALMQALSIDTDHVYLIGQGGIGKTTTLVHIMSEAYGEGQTYTENCQIPLYISLSNAPDTYGALYEGGKSTFIRRAIYKQVREDRTLKQIGKKELGKLDEAFSVPFDTAVQPIEDLLSEKTPAPEYLLLLDGLNEVSRAHVEEAKRSVIEMILQEINWLMEECPNVRVILTGRADESMIHGEHLTRLALSGVEDDIIREYLSSCECEQAKIDRVFVNDSLRETLRVPLFLVMYGNLRENDEVTTQGEILRTFFNESKNALRVYTVQDRLSQVEDDVENAASAVQKMRITSEMQCFMLDFLLPEIAWYMEQRNLFAIDEETVAEIIEPVLTGTADTDICGRYGKQVFDKYCIEGSAKTHTRKTAKDILSKLGSDMEEVTESFIDCCMFSLGILSANNGKYGFVHQHIRDYFASQKVVNQMWLSVCLSENEQDDMAYECLGIVLRDKPLSLTLRRFIGESLGEHKNKPQFIDGQWRYVVPEELCERSLIRYTLDVLRGVKCTAEYDLYNLIRIMAEIRVDLSGEDLSALDFTKCSLNDIRLSRPDLVADVREILIPYSSLFSQNHSDRFSGGCFGGNSEKLITYSADGTIKTWDITTMECIRTIKEHAGAVKSLKYLKHNKKYISASNDKTVRIWDETEFKCEKILRYSSMISKIYISKDEQFICLDMYDYNKDNLAVNNTLHILDCTTMECVGEVDLCERVEAVVFSEDNKYLYIIVYEYLKDCDKVQFCCRTWNIVKNCNEEIFKYPLCDSGCYCENSNKMILQESVNIQIWDVVSKVCEKRIEKSIHKIRSAIMSFDEKSIIISDMKGKSTIYDSISFNKITVLKKNGCSNFDAYYSLDDKVIITRGSDNLCIWHTNTYSCCGILTAYQTVVDSIEFTQDAQGILTVARDNTIKVFNEKSNKKFELSGILRTQNYRPESCSFSSDGKRIVVCSLDLVAAPSGIWNYCVINWDAKTLSKISEHNFCNIELGGCGYIPARDELVVEYSEKFEIIDANDYSIRKKLGKDDDLRSATYSNNGKYFIVASKNYTAKIYDTDSWLCVGELVTDTKFGCIRYSPDGKYIAASCANHGKDPVIHIWDAVTLECIQSLYGHSSGRTLANIDFKFDSSRLISASYDGTVKIWDLTSYECIGELKHNAGVTSAHYSSDGELIVTSSFDGTAKIWDANTYECLQTIPNIPGLFIQGLDLRNLAPGSNFTEEDKHILRMYGALID